MIVNEFNLEYYKNLFEDLTDLEVGLLKVVQRTEITLNSSKWLCQCRCKDRSFVELTAATLLSKRVKSCGCRSTGGTLRHAKARRGRVDPLYRKWLAFNERVNNPNHENSDIYGTRKVCDAWKVFENFRDWALANGWQEGLEIDRIDGTGDYEPSNCRFSTRKEQNCNLSSNRYVEFKGEKLTVSQAVVKYGTAGLIPQTFVTRLNLGWEVEKALTFPPKLKGKFFYYVIGDVHGCVKTLLKLLNMLGFKICNDLRSCRAPFNTKIIFTGDLVDRGPHSYLVLELVANMVANGIAEVVTSNHDDKLRRYLKATLKGEEFIGNLSNGLDETVAQLNKESVETRQRIYNFLSSTKQVFEYQNLKVVHAAFKEGLPPKVQRAYNLYGQTTGKKNSEGYPERLTTWRESCPKDEIIVHGHVAQKDGNYSVYINRNGGTIINVDTACCFGGKLTAYKFPLSPLDSNAFTSVGLID